MQLMFAIHVIITLLMFKPATSQTCDVADWGTSLDRRGWSVCPKRNTYLRGFWRHDRRLGDERVGRLEEGRCCEADDPSYANQPAACLNANWASTLDGSNVWALCPAGYYLNGLRLQCGPPAFLSDINDGQCCRPQNHPNSYEDCYDEDVTSSFDTRGWSECQRPAYYMTGFYKSNCNDLNCIDKFRCCKMKKVDFNSSAVVHGGWSDFGDWSECSVPCGSGIKERRRTCTNPSPANGGQCCVGDNMEAQSCNTEPCEGEKATVDGGWSDFGDWSECNVKCGGGIKERRRTCTNPPPANGGQCCLGDNIDVESCNPEPCEEPNGPVVCPDGWVLHGNSCFLIIDTPTVHRNDARKKCQQLGGDLAKITSATENQFIFDLLRKQDTITLYGVWLGLHRKADTKFYWADDTPLAGYTAWGATEPSSLYEKCGHMIGYGPRGGKWNDISCTFPAAFHPSTAPVILCQKERYLPNILGN